MKKNFEMRRSITILIGVLMVFFIYQFVLTNMFYEQLKEDNVKVWGAVTAKLVEINPEQEHEIMEIVTGNSSDIQSYSEIGKEIFQEYGLTDDLNLELFPYLNKRVAQNSQFLLCGFLVFALLLILVNYLQFKQFFSKIREFTFAANKIISGDYSVTVNENKEGDFGKLALSFRSMKDVIRKSMTDLQEEKKFLVQILQDISHQLKTPLSTLQVNNDILGNKQISNQEKYHFLQNNQVQISRMNVLIQNLLKVSRIDAHAVSFEKENNDIMETIYDVLDNLQSKISEKNMTINIESKEEIIVFHDKIWLQEALLNILKNSIEHSDHDSFIAIKVESNPIYTEITIKDFGEGIAPEDIPHIFERFYKRHNSKKSDSIGIGLALAKSIIEAHNGYIKVESEKTVFTKFIITIMKY
ncbi:HAMP domain-containing sensor histidine kinase [Peribacillus aracenensis]|uniref:HAMP domain-containing sensor histidine kinase n=1 Tax=Peribacillus aracenensis TaxID=2976708 RepID=UPI0021A37BA4|nr:HAMP domain-containing sensor histidine kinase [Peribacillus sp. BBB004]